MMAIDQLSKVSVTLQNKQVETIALSQNLSTVKTTNMALKAHVKDLEKENCALDKVACGLLDKVNTKYYDTI